MEYYMVYTAVDGNTTGFQKKSDGLELLFWNEMYCNTSVVYI